MNFDIYDSASHEYVGVPLAIVAFNIYVPLVVGAFGKLLAVRAKEILFGVGIVQSAF